MEKGHSPRPANVADAERIIAIVKQLNDALPEDSRASIDEGVLRKLAHCAGGEINPMAAMFGGVVGQEVVKAMSGKVGGRVIGRKHLGMHVDAISFFHQISFSQIVLRPYAS